MKSLIEKPEGPEASLRRAEKLLRGLIMYVDELVKQDRLDYKDLQRLSLINIAVCASSGDDPGVARRANFIRQQIDSLARIMEKESQEAFQQSLSNRVQAIEIELEKDYRR